MFVRLQKGATSDGASNNLGHPHCPLKAKQSTSSDSVTLVVIGIGIVRIVCYNYNMLEFEILKRLGLDRCAAV